MRRSRSPTQTGHSRPHAATAQQYAGGPFAAAAGLPPGPGAVRRTLSNQSISSLGQQPSGSGLDRSADSVMSQQGVDPVILSSAARAGFRVYRV